MSFTTVSSPAGLTMSATAPAWHYCPYVEEKDEGTVTVTWLTGTHTFELHSLRRHLDEFSKQWGHEAGVSHERFTKEVLATFRAVDGTPLQILSVRTDWTTAGMAVTCST